jgi:hypothetical protein
MSDFGTMVRRIRTDINRGASFDTRIKEAICDAIVYYKNRRLGFNIKRARAVLTSGNETVSLPTDWLEADFLRLESDGDRDPLGEVTYDWMEDTLRTDDDRARPQKFAVQHRELRLYPIPDRSYTLVLSFHFELKNVSISASDGAQNGWTIDAEQLIRKKAQADVLANYIGGPESIQRATQLYNPEDDYLGECGQVLRTLEAAAAREQSSGKIKGWL